MKFIPLVILFFVFNSGSLKAQSGRTWSAQELENANTAKNISYLNDEEKNIIFYMNLVRTNGEKFFNTYFQEFADAYNIDMQQYSNYNELKINRKDKYYRGLEKDLKDIKGLTLFSPDETLTWVAQQHAKDLKKHNLAGHNSSDGRTVSDRISKFYPRRQWQKIWPLAFPKD